LTKKKKLDLTLLKVMKTAQLFAEYNREALSGSLSENVDIPEDNLEKNMTSDLAFIFWEMAEDVFRSDVEKHPDIPAEHHKAFLTAAETVLQAGIRIRVSTNRYIYQTWIHRHLLAYVLQHRSHLPGNFVSTLKRAAETGVLEVAKILFYLSMEGNICHELQGLREPSELWSVLEAAQPRSNEAL
jgi:hypothetical protein